MFTCHLTLGEGAATNIFIIWGEALGGKHRPHIIPRTLIEGGLTYVSGDTDETPLVVFLLGDVKKFKVPFHMFPCLPELAFAPEQLGLPEAVPW